MSSLVNNLINPILESNQEYTVYFDVDDTLTNYTENLLTTNIKDKKILEIRQIKPSDTASNKEFWVNAKWYPGSKEMFNYIKSKFPNVKILSAVPELSKLKQQETGNKFYNEPIEGKSEWLNKNVGNIEKIWVKNGKEKAEYASPTSILIDDKLENIKHFEDAGGIGILMDNPKNVINKINTLSNTLNELINRSLPYQQIIRDKYSSVLDKLFLIPYNDNYVELNIIKIKPEFRDKGYATKILNDITKWADENNKILTLDPNETFGSNKDRLIDFYKRFGFKLNNGNDKKADNEMVRTPQLSLNENATYSNNINYKNEIKEITKFLLDKGENIQPLPKVTFKNGDKTNAKDFMGKTAYYDPNSSEIVLYTEGRHPRDIIASYLHELIHHIQNIEGRLHNIQTQNVHEDESLELLEREAYEKGGMFLRSYKDNKRIIDIPKFNYEKTIYHELYDTLNEITLSKENAVGINGDLEGGDFKVGDITYVYSINNIINPYKDEGKFYNISFYPDGNINAEPLEGKENYIKILSTIYKIVVDFAEKVKPEYIGIASMDNNENKNYHRIYANLTDNKYNRIPGYFRKDVSKEFITPQGKGRFVVLKRNKNIEEDLKKNEIKYWAIYYSIYEKLKENINYYSFLKDRLKGEQLSALDYFYNILTK